MTGVVDADSGTFVRAGDIRLYCHDVGEGPVVVLLHGADPGASAWWSFSGVIEALAVAHRVLAVDLPGFGRSDPVAGAAEPAATLRARALRDMLDVLGIARASFVGNSMGGTVAMVFAIDHPERTERLVVLGPAGVLPTLTTPQPTEGHRALNLAARNPTWDTLRRAMDVMLYDPAALPPEAFEARVETAQRVPLTETSSRDPAVPWRDLHAELGRVVARTLVLWGREDRVNPLEIGLLLLRDIPDARLVVLKECGHLPQVEHPDEVARLALDFLSR